MLDGDKPTVLMPEPVSVIVCGLPGASSEIVTAAFLLPSTPGLNVTLTEQLLLAPSVEPQLDVGEKSPTFAPVTLIELMFSVL
jgi:hypothetical protein